MRRHTFLLVLMLGITAVLATPAAAHRMADYWSLNEGNVLVYDRDMFVVGMEKHVFGGYMGTPYFQAREFCNNHAYLHVGPEGILLVGLYSLEGNQFVDLSSYAITLSKAEMNVGEFVTSTIPAGAVDSEEITFTVTLLGVEPVTVPAGTFNNTLKLNVYVVDGTGTYTEKIWLAKGVGPVQMYRESETNNTPGCFFTCGSLGCESDVVQERYTRLKSYVTNRNRAVVIPLY